MNDVHNTQRKFHSETLSETEQEIDLKNSDLKPIQILGKISTCTILHLFCT